MPRAYCPECAAEVPVDAEGTCHVGHEVDLAGASVGDTVDVRPATDETDEADEPQPWVASVDPTSSGGDGGDDLAAAAAAAIESLQTDADEPVGPDPVEASGRQVGSGWPGTLPAEGDTPGWTPPTNDPVTPPPVPAPAPADPPAPADDDLGDGDFDLDDLAAAVSDLDMDDDTAPAAPVDTADPGRSDARDAWEQDLGEPSADRPDDGPHDGPEAADEDAVDLSNFTAKSGKVDTDGGGGGRKGGLFRRR